MSPAPGAAGSPGGRERGALAFAGTPLSYALLDNADHRLDTLYDVSLMVSARPRRRLDRPQCLLRYLGGGGGGSGVALYLLPGGAVEFRLARRGDGDGDAVLVTSPGALVEPETWVDIAAVYSNPLGRAKLYVNGALVSDVEVAGSRPLATDGDLCLAGCGVDPYEGELACLEIRHNAVADDVVQAAPLCMLRKWLIKVVLRHGSIHFGNFPLVAPIGMLLLS